MPLTIEVGHYGDYPITSLNTTLQLIHPFSNTLKPDTAAAFYKGTVEQGGIVSFTFTLTIDSQAELKSYGLTDDQINQRLAQLSTDELQQLATGAEAIAAGGEQPSFSTTTWLLIIVILLILAD